MTQRLRRQSQSENALQIDDLLLRLNGLVRVRELLRQRHASDSELEAHSAEIGRLQWRLSRLVVEAQRAGRSQQHERPAS